MQTHFVICKGRDGTMNSNGDVLIFPDMIRYRKLTHFDVDKFIKEVLVKHGKWLPGSPKPLTGWYIFVCCHGSSHRRCGISGPNVVRKFKKEIKLRGLTGKISVSPCSQIGGNLYTPGNVLIFGRDSNMEVTGHRYGYVLPEHVPLLIDRHIQKGEIVNFLWKGRIGFSEEHKKTSPELSFRSAEQCHQVDEGNFNCCEITESQETSLGEKNSFKMCAVPTWYESWEREDTLAVLAVIGAAISVALACKCYK
ncbi:uncharacterized protein LOC127249705 [Andrographis paniculata]|uniref:uncharacterized protein LOC127249705 n=1 Tax=Andrographis paniculata TaxID=175694 RepID=UPI0021E8804D|nr:uncharacterized protein LOC127249705 [Andrographis paniculata]